jgi:hypothetical protein
VLPPSGFISFEQGAPQSLWALGLTGPLKSGQGVNLVFEFSNGAAPLILPVPVSTPLTPAPRGSVNPEENEEAGTAN